MNKPVDIEELSNTDIIFKRRCVKCNKIYWTKVPTRKLCDNCLDDKLRNFMGVF